MAWIKPTTRRREISHTGAPLQPLEISLHCSTPNRNLAEQRGGVDDSPFGRQSIRQALTGETDGMKLVVG